MLTERYEKHFGISNGNSLTPCPNYMRREMR